MMLKWFNQQKLYLHNMSDNKFNHLVKTRAGCPQKMLMWFDFLCITSQTIPPNLGKFKNTRAPETKLRFDWCLMRFCWWWSDGCNTEPAKEETWLADQGGKDKYDNNLLILIRIMLSSWVKTSKIHVRMLKETMGLVWNSDGEQPHWVSVTLRPTGWTCLELGTSGSSLTEEQLGGGWAGRSLAAGPTVCWRLQTDPSGCRWDRSAPRTQPESLDGSESTDTSVTEVSSRYTMIQIMRLMWQQTRPTYMTILFVFSADSSGLPGLVPHTAVPGGVKGQRPTRLRLRRCLGRRHSSESGDGGREAQREVQRPEKRDCQRGGSLQDAAGGREADAVWRTHSEHVNTPGTHLRYTWNTPEIHLKHTWNTPEIHVNTPVTHLRYTWNTPVTHLRYMLTHL